MALPRILLAWALVSCWFIIWGEARRRFLEDPGEPTRLDSIVLRADLTEALLLTLFAGLWFASLGHGGWLVLFTVAGLLLELPPRLRNRSAPPRSWLLAALGVVRIIVAGGLLAWRLE